MRSRSDRPQVPSHAILGEKVYNLSWIGTSRRSRNVALNLKHLNAFYSYIKVSEVRVRLGITSGYARAPKVLDISSKYRTPLWWWPLLFGRVFEA
jgi:hypothetical protein